MGGYRVIGILSYCNLVMKYFLEDEVSSVWSILISCSSGIQSEVVVVMCVCALVRCILWWWNIYYMKTRGSQCDNNCEYFNILLLPGSYECCPPPAQDLQNQVYIITYKRNFAFT